MPELPVPRSRSPVVKFVDKPTADVVVMMLAPSNIYTAQQGSCFFVSRVSISSWGIASLRKPTRLSVQEPCTMEAGYLVKVYSPQAGI